MNKHPVRPMLVAMALAAALAGCSHSDASAPITVAVKNAPLMISIHAEGQLKAVKSTSLTVPGRMWSRRQLVWRLPDGSRVKKGEVVARFSARQSKQDLAVALIDLALNKLSRVDKQSDLAKNRGQLRVNLAQVASQLAIANRYANATIDAIARNKILDAVQNKHFLKTKQGVLQWRQGESSTRSKAELAVIDAKRATLDLQVKQKRGDLDALTLRAPHAGILMLHTDWSGQKPQIGASFFAGRTFAELPNLDQLQVVLQVPQVQAQGLHPGLEVKLHPLGAPKQLVTSKITWVAAAASPISRQNPVKYLAVKVSVPTRTEQHYGWVPGMRFGASIILLDATSVLSVPNLALDTRGDAIHVRVDTGGKVVKRKVTLGVRGPARSQVVSGLKAGDRVVLERRLEQKTPKAKSAKTPNKETVS